MRIKVIRTPLLLFGMLLVVCLSATSGEYKYPGKLTCTLRTSNKASQEMGTGGYTRIAEFYNEGRADLDCELLRKDYNGKFGITAVCLCNKNLNTKWR